MKTLSTDELRSYLDGLFDKLRPFAEGLERYIVYNIFNINFSDRISHMPPGMFCYSDGKSYHYGEVGDYGEVTSEEFDNLFDLTYEIISFQTHGLAFAYAHKNSDKQNDIRRIAFPQQIELMKIIGDDYVKMVEAKITEILKEAPYDDSLYAQFANS